MPRGSGKSCKRPPRIEIVFTWSKGIAGEMSLTGDPWWTINANYKKKSSTQGHQHWCLVVGPESTEPSSQVSAALSPLPASFRSDSEGVGEIVTRIEELKCQASFLTVDFQPEADLRRGDLILSSDSWPFHGTGHVYNQSEKVVVT